VPGEGAAGDSTLYATVKLLDIGLGRALFDEADGTGGDHAELTAEGTILGTPDYMAPEQARDSHAADIRSDIYSIGCTLYHALAGQPPFPDTNLVRKMVRHATEPTPPVKKFNAEVSDGLQQIVGWMMAKDPAQRYPTPERAAQALQAFLAAGTETLPGPAATPQFRAFLDWLDSESGEETPPRATATATALKPPAPKAVPPPPADVERVAAAPAEGPARHTPLALSRRDYLMLGIGAGGLLAAGGVGWLLSSLFKKKKSNNGEQKSPGTSGTTP
jgi:serine/threonine protein kinase